MTKKEKINKDEKKKCGIIMPIAPTPDYPKEHWKEVLNILVEAISETEFEARLVSDDVAIGLIHERIVNNIYNDEIVVCDVSSKNPNVMFELGLRLAFDKPTIIIKDEKTGYSFDTGVIEHLNYPSSLRFNNIVEFKKELVKKINATYKKSTSEENFSPFLKSFGKMIVPAKIKGTEITEMSYIIEELEYIKQSINSIKSKENLKESLDAYEQSIKISLYKKIKDLTFSAETKSILLNDGFELLGDILMLKRPFEYFKNKNIKKNTIVEIEKILIENGLHFGMDIRKYLLP